VLIVFFKVKAATVKKTGQQFAIKIIKKDFLKEQNKNKDVVFKERELLSLLDHHPLIVRLHYTFQSPSCLCKSNPCFWYLPLIPFSFITVFVMDYCERGELFSVLKEVEKLYSIQQIWRSPSTVPSTLNVLVGIQRKWCWRWSISIPRV